MNNVAEFLEAHLNDPAALLRSISSPAVGAIVADFPVFRELVEERGVRLGGGEQPEFVMRVWSSALEEGSRACLAAAPVLRTKLRRADAGQFCGELVSFVSSSTLLAMIVANGTSDTPKIAAAALSLVTTITAAVAGFLRKGMKGDRVELYSRMVRLASEADMLVIQFKIWTEASSPPLQEAQALAEKARAVVTEIREVLAAV